MTEEKLSFKQFKFNGFDDCLLVDVPFFDFKQKKLIMETTSDVKYYISYDVNENRVNSRQLFDQIEREDSNYIVSFEPFGSYFICSETEDEPDYNTLDDNNKRVYAITVVALVPTSVGLLDIILNDGNFDLYGPHVAQEMIEMLT